MEILSRTVAVPRARATPAAMPMGPFEVLDPAALGPLVLTCEHASCLVPTEYNDLGLETSALREHIGWDIGARHLTEHLAMRFRSAAVLSRFSRLVIDCNRGLDDADLIVAESHGVRIPGNVALDVAERDRRIGQIHRPYHGAIDAVLERRPDAFLLSLHSFTPCLNGNERRFDVGVLFDAHADEAHRLGRELAAEGLEIRYNQPYSAFDGLIFSAATHGREHHLRYLELEVNNRLLREVGSSGRVAIALEHALARFLEV